MIWFLAFILFQGSAQAHIIGTDPWCIANSPVHYECHYLDSKECELAAQKHSDVYEQWRCVSYPVDFRLIPKSGETLPNVEPRPSLLPTPSPVPSVSAQRKK